MTQPDEAGTDDGAQEPAGFDAIRADIEQTRAELAETVDQLTDRLNVKNQAKNKASAVKETVSDKVTQAKEAAPEPVQHALDTAAAKAGPVAHQVNEVTAPHRGKIIAGVAAAAVVLLIIRRRSSD